jgi:hypothetical protein
MLTRRVRWFVAAVVLFGVGVTVGVAVQRSADSDARRAESVREFRRDVTVAESCGPSSDLPPLSSDVAYDWTEGRRLWGTLYVTNDGHSDVRIERLDVVWPNEPNEPLQIAIRQIKALPPNGCVPKPVDDARGTLLNGPITLSPGESANFEYSIVMLHCRGMSPDMRSGAPSPFHWTMTRDGERFQFATGPTDELDFLINQASHCAPA